MPYPLPPGGAVSTPQNPNWLDATTTANEALDLAKLAVAMQRAHFHVTTLMLATLAKTAPPEAVAQLHAELERVRDLSGPAGASANELFATAVSTIERFQRRE
jgi:hypothetical protein